MVRYDAIEAEVLLRKRDRTVGRGIPVTIRWNRCQRCLTDHVQDHLVSMHPHTADVQIYNKTDSINEPAQQRITKGQRLSSVVSKLSTTTIYIR